MSKGVGGKKILAVITARGNSRGLPGKNIKKLGGKPLIVYTIEAAKKSKYITHTIVSTDDLAIARTAKKAGAEVPFMRPAELAQDDTPHAPVMQHAIRFMEDKMSIKFDYAVVLQPTSPFRLPEDIDRTLELLIKSGADSGVSLVQLAGTEHPIKAKKLAGFFVEPYSEPEVEGVVRQKFPAAYKRSGAVYAMKRDLIINDSKIYGEKIVGHVVPKERSIDIDTPHDWAMARIMYQHLSKKNSDEK